MCFSKHQSTINWAKKISQFFQYLIFLITLLAWFIIFIAGCNIESQPPRCEIIAIQKYTDSDIDAIIDYIELSEDKKTPNQIAKYDHFSKSCGNIMSIIKENYERRNKYQVYLILIEIIFGWGITSVGIISCLSAAIGASFSYLSNKNSEPEWWIIYLHGVMRGFVIYCLYLGGLLIFNEKVLKFLENFSILDYVRLSASISIISFFVGFNPRILNLLLPNIVQDKNNEF